MEWLLLKTLFSLVAVLGLMFGVVWFLKKYVYRGRSGSSSQIEIEVLGHRSLQPKRSVVVLKVMHKVIVVGMSEHGMQTLTEIADLPASTEEFSADLEEATGVMTGSRPGDLLKGGARAFADHLQAYVHTVVGGKRRTGGKSRMHPLA